MNIYAIRDRLLNYYQQPFAAHADTDVLAALSRSISNGGDDVISQAPQHFEIWRLGRVTKDGHLTDDNREYLADLSALVRTRRQTTTATQRELQTAQERSQRATQRPGEAPNAEQRTPQDEAPPKDGQGAQEHRGTDRAD